MLIGLVQLFGVEEVCFERRCESIGNIKSAPGESVVGGHSGAVYLDTAVQHFVFTAFWFNTQGS